MGGLEDFLRRAPRNVFHRLYQDALRRIRRLDEATRAVKEANVLRIISHEDLPENLKNKLILKSQQIMGKQWDGTVRDGQGMGMNPMSSAASMAGTTTVG